MMPGMPDLDMLPPEIASRLREQQAAAEEFAAAVASHHYQGRLAMLEYACIFCSCTTRYAGHGSEFPQAHCMVHGQFLIGPDGSCY